MTTHRYTKRIMQCRATARSLLCAALCLASTSSPALAQRATTLSFRPQPTGNQAYSQVAPLQSGQMMAPSVAPSMAASPDGSQVPHPIPSHQPMSVNNPIPMTGTTIGDTNCGYSRCNLPPQPTGVPSGCPQCITGIDCANSPYAQKWCDRSAVNFSNLYHGEFLGPVRLPSVQQYRVRVGDRIRFIFVLSRELLVDQYRLMANDEVMIESLTDPTLKQGDLTRGVTILPDGTITLKIVGPMRAEGLTVEQLRRNIEAAYTPMLKTPGIDVIPVRFNSALEDLRAAVDGRAGAGGQNIADTVHPDGTISLPKLGPICVLGLTLQEIKREVNLRYRQIVTGIQVDPILDSEAPHFAYVYGEVLRPDRYQLNGPTSVTQLLTMAQGVKPGGNSRQIVVFRRAEDYRLLATRLDIRGELLGKEPTPADEIWMRDNDIVIVPPTPIRRFDNFVEQVFTRGIYGIVPFQGIGITKFQNGSIGSN